MSGRSTGRTRTGGPGGALRLTSRVNDSNRAVGNQRSGRPRFGSTFPSEEPERQRVWGKVPYTQAQRKDLVFLFAEQKRLRDVLRRQARLARLDEACVRSTEAEHMRVLNLLIVDAVPSVDGVINPFIERNLTDAQTRSEDMVRRQWKKLHGGNAAAVKPTTATSKPVRSRRKRAEPTEGSPAQVRLVDCFKLRGPLAREFARAVERGYKGTPECWLRGPRAKRLYSRYRASRSPVIDWTDPDLWSIFDYRSPLHWAVTSSSVMQSTGVLHGFQGERLRSKDTNVVVLRRQASSAQRLKKHNWPRGFRGGCAWPTYPTLNESWEMLLRSMSERRRILPIRSSHTRSYKIPTKLVKPGSLVRAISKYILGVRADIEVPKGTLGYFRYRWGFLILVRKDHLPSNLVRFLSKLWKEDFSSLMMSEPIRLNDALRRLPSSSQWQLLGYRYAGLLESSRVKNRRQRPPRPVRIQMRQRNLEPATSDASSGRAPSSDKSDGGVRLH
jgi:hypothetical protein